jgi:hypothetical protein
VLVIDDTENQVYLNNTRLASDYLTMHKEIKQTADNLDLKYKASKSVRDMKNLRSLTELVTLRHGTRNIG